MIAGILLPIFALGALAVLVTRGVEALMPETVAGIAATGVIAAAALWVLSSLGFAALYAMETPEVLDLLKPGTGGIWHFANLGLQAALVWAPILLLVVITAPQRWKTNTW